MNNKEKSKNLFTNKVKLRSTIIISTLLASMMLVFVIIIANYSNAYKKAEDDVLEISKNSTYKDAKDIERFLLKHSEVLSTTAVGLEFLLDQSITDKTTLKNYLHDVSLSYNADYYESIEEESFKGIYICPIKMNLFMDLKLMVLWTSSLIMI